MSLLSFSNEDIIDDENMNTNNLTDLIKSKTQNEWIIVRSSKAFDDVF